MYELDKGEYLTLDCTAVDDDGNAVDISSGYSFVATVKENLGVEDAAAFVHINDADNPTRFSVATSVLTVFLLISSESNAAESRVYYYDIWIVKDSNGQETKVEKGTIQIGGPVTNTKT